MHRGRFTMRTLDIGGDKALPYFPIEEDNPFLGWRGIRVTLDHPEIFLSQVRAMLKANEGLGNLRIMLPMICNVDELDEALDLIRSQPQRNSAGRYGGRIAAHRRDGGGALGGLPGQGAGVAGGFPFPWANDLTQYLLAVDRNNARVADLYHSLHPAVLQALADVAEAGRKEGKPVSICGELASDPEGAVLLLAMGYDVLSMNATSLPKVKKALRNVI